jgi:hypothetical protein
MDAPLVPRTRGGALSVLASFRPHKHPKATTLTLLWVLGLYAVFFAPAPVALTPERVAAYQLRLKEADGLLRDVAAAERHLMEQEFRVREVQPWFWRLRPEARAAVAARRPAADAAREVAAAARGRRAAALRAAKAELGVWSEAGVEESRALLWSSFDSGKVFAQRQTFWDSIFTVLNSRDKDWLYLLLQLLFTAITNYTVGALVAVVVFAFSLPGLLASFAPSWPSALAFFAVSLVGAAAMVATYLAMLYAAGGAVVYTAASFASVQRARLAQGGGAPRQRLRHHYD